MRPKNVTRVLWSAAWLGLVAGCTTIPPKGGFDEVQALLAERFQHEVFWDQGTLEDEQVRQRLRALLETELTVDAAVQVALLNNRHLQATYEELGIAQAELVQAGLLANPVFEFSPRWVVRSGSGFSYEWSVVQDFIDVLALPLRQRAAAGQFEAAKRRVADAVLDTAADVKVAYYRLQGAEELAAMRRTVLAATDAAADAAQRLHQAGNITDLALANEQALHEQAKVDLIRAEAAALDAREVLNALLGVWGPDTQWRMAARLPGLPAEEIEPTGLESLAVTQRLDLAAAREEVQSLANAVNLREYSRIPFNLGVHGAQELESGGPVTLGPHLEAQLPLFDQGQAGVAAARARLRQGEQHYAALAVDIRAQVRRLRARMLAERSRAHYYHTVVLPLRHRAVLEAQLQYNAMQIGVFQLLAARQAEIDAGRDYVEALRDYWVARSELERAVGGKLPSAPAPESPAPHTDHQHGDEP